MAARMAADARPQAEEGHEHESEATAEAQFLYKKEAAFDLPAVIEALRGQAPAKVLDELSSLKKTGISGDTMRQAEEALDALLEEELCEALVTGNCKRTIELTELTEALWGGSSGSGSLRGYSSSSRRKHGVLTRRPGASSVLRKTRGATAVWEADVDAAWIRGDADELHWAIGLAEAAGAPAEKLAGPRTALKQLAEGALSDAVRRGDAAASSRALRVAAQAGVSEAVLADARLTMAEVAGDPYMVEQELAQAEAAALPACRLADARQRLQRLRDNEHTATAGERLSICSTKAPSERVSMTSSPWWLDRHPPSSVVSSLPER
eukprot:gnl/TRDRNA2_/TRDRNA2_80834_c0_seq1.p1 gnl/TRDRNA2_/TRDRNA2_80834_c0~~gnl/TRDRNA2_/TRDRNA2_80834_c0_seq1.p1  ORF type:complete len:323 (-),score=71.62 gnl/TRDRNA2_/TRDRNA2_80834_c0_seq1:2-970(-)